MQDLLTVEEVATLCRVKKGKAYEIMREINSGMTKEGYLTIRGRVNRVYLMKRLGIE